ncbi:MAG TPA: dTDP-4-dehydrorhamnose reductase [Verrucomicrobiae bacterium]
MNPPKILLLGKNGQVGWELQRTLAPLGQVWALDYPEIDFAEGAALRKLVLEHKPTIVVNACAYTAVDKAESEPERAMLINGLAPGVLAEAAKQTGALLVHFSTDYVFDGTKRTPYIETDAPNPLSAYGRTKLAGDQAIQQVGCNHLIFRLCWVYGARGQNFMLTMMRLARERETLRVVADQIGSPTWSRMIAEATALALKQTLSLAEARELSGVYHLRAGGETNWHEFASRIVELMPPAERKCKVVEAIPTADYPTPAKRPAYSVMSCEKLLRTFGIGLPNWEYSLRQVLDKP